MWQLKTSHNCLSDTEYIYNKVYLSERNDQGMNVPESILIKRLQKGEEDAFQELVEMYQNKVYNTCLGYVKNPDDADDLAQEVFIKVFQSIGKFKGKSSLSTWIYRITINESLDFLRKIKRKKRAGIFGKLFGIDDHSITEATDFDHPGIKAENKEQAKILYAAIERLPENQRTAFTLHKLEGLSYEQIAEVLDKSVSSVESLMFRAKNNLKNELYAYYQNL
jgi:RNA polymerase sigma-70 factor (ECF subfamily)